jgi:hypothetical protein
MDTNIILQDFTTATKPASLLYSIKTRKILGFKSKLQIASLQSAERGSLVTVVTCMSPTGHFIPPLLVFPIKQYETRSDEWHTTWINPRVPSLGVDIERDFFPMVSSFHPTYKAKKRRSC